MRTAIQQLESLSYMRIVRDRSASDLRRDLRQIIRRQRFVEAAAEPAQASVTDRPAVDRAQSIERLQQIRDELAKKTRASAMPRDTA